MDWESRLTPYVLSLHRKFTLAGCKENQRIFGAVHRPEASRKALLHQSFSFALTAGTFALSGRAAVTSVSQEEIKLQLLAGKSAFNFDSTNTDNGEEVYIDELPLGIVTQRIHIQSLQWINDHWQEYIDSFAGNTWITGKNNALPAALFSKIFTARERTQYMFGGSDETDCVFFPIYSEADEAWSNYLDYRYWGDDIYMGDDASPRHTWRMDLETYFFRLKTEKAFPLPHTAALGAYLFQELKPIDGEWVNDDFSVAPQPYLCYVVEQIFAALGYTLRPENNALRQGAFKNVFIANARNTENLADMLPHWTVREFFENLQKFLNVMILVNGTQVSVVSRNTAYATNAPTVLYHVTDEQSTDLDEDDSSKDPTAGNVGYDFPDEMIAKNALGKRYEEVEIRRFNSYAEIEADLAQLDYTVKLGSNILYIDMTTGERYYIAYVPSINPLDFSGTFELRTIDLMGPLWRTDKDEIDTQLKFVPCRMHDYIPTYRTKMEWGDRIEKYAPETPHPVNPDNIDLDGGKYGGFHIPYLITSDTRESIKETKLNLSQEVMKEPDEEETADDSEATGKRDVIELAYNPDVEHYFCYEQSYNPLTNYDFQILVRLAYPVGIPYYKDRFEQWKDEGEPLFVLRNRTGQVARELDALSLDIDTRSLTQFQFTDALFDPTAVVLIRGRKYVCQKLEVTINEHGLQPLKRGYFYELGT